MLGMTIVTDENELVEGGATMLEVVTGTGRGEAEFVDGLAEAGDEGK